MGRNLISIILPTYNRAKLIHRAINSVINQIYQEFQLIIVDDASIDNTEEIIKTYKDSRIYYIKLNNNMGPAGSRNIGIKYSEGEYLAFIDSDDEWFPEKLEKQLEIFLKYNDKNLGMVYTDMIRISKENQKTYWRSPDFKTENKNLYEKSLNYGVENIGISTAMIKRKCFEKVGFFDLNLKRLEDLEFFIRLSKYFNFYHLNIPLVYYYQTEYSVSSSLINLINARKYILEKYFNDIAKDRKILSNHYFLIGFALYQNKELKNSKKYLIKSLYTYAFNFKNSIKSILIIITNGKLYEILSFIKQKIVCYIFIIKYILFILKNEGFKVLLIKTFKFIKKRLKK